MQKARSEDYENYSANIKEIFPIHSLKKIDGMVGKVIRKPRL